MSKNKLKKHTLSNRKKNTTKLKSSKNISPKKMPTRKTVKKKEYTKKRKTIVKKSLTTAKVKKSSLSTSFLVLALFLCALAIGIIVFILLSQFVRKNNLLTPPIPHQLSTITDETTFLTIKNSLLQNATNSKSGTSECFGATFFHTPLQKTTSAHNKFLIILKRGKLFVTNTATNKFIGYTEISPYPIKEKNAIAYDSVFANDDTIIVTGYRAETNSLEISTFLINLYGKITRGTSYNLPSSNCNFASDFTANKLTFYTSRTLSSKVTLLDINTLNKWSDKLNKFTTMPIENNATFYDNASLLNNPIIHTVTTCQLQKDALLDCQQRHLIDNPSSGHYLNANNFYLWTTQISANDTPGRIIPGSKLYEFSLSKPAIKMAQVEGIPVLQNSLLERDDNLFAKIYQNNSYSPAWHTNFTKNRTSNFKFSLNGFPTSGGFVNSPDNYNLPTTTLSDILDNNEQIIATDPNIISLNNTTSTINVYGESIKSFSIDGNILSVEKLPNQQDVLIIYKKDGAVAVQKINISTSSLSSPLILKDDLTTTPIAKLSFIITNNETFASATFIEGPLNKGSIYLLKISNDTITKIDNLALTKSYQRVTDGCQNDCQQSWTDQAEYFLYATASENNKSTIIYAVAGSKLKKLTIDNTGTTHPSRIIDYTYKPAPPKPRRPRARIPGGAKKVNGKYVCGKKHGYVGKSKSNNKGYLHLDLECCLDPDEYPNPWCTYKPGELGVTNLRYKDYHGRVKRKKH